MKSGEGQQSNIKDAEEQERTEQKGESEEREESEEGKEAEEAKEAKERKELTKPKKPKKSKKLKKLKESKEPKKPKEPTESKQVNESKETDESIESRESQKAKKLGSVETEEQNTHARRIEAEQPDPEHPNEIVGEKDQQNSNAMSESNLENNPEDDNNNLSISKGPFESHQLIQNLPSNLEYTCFEAYDENVYLGTKTGDLLHYFEIEQHNYMLVSQTKFDDESNHPIKKIILLPMIERALVLCDNVLVVFLLPEFAPAPNTIKVRGVSDLAVRNYSDQFNYYKFYVTKEDSIKLLKISPQAINITQSYNFGLIKRACAYEYTLMTAKANTYEIINLKDSTIIPLFRVSETDAPLKPIITNFSVDEFLVTTGGNSNKDSSIVFVVNSDGEISHGTMVLNEYPEEILVEYPYMLIQFGSSRVEVYRISPNSEPQLVQKMTAKHSSLGMCRTSKLFNNFEQKEVREKVTNKLRLVPLLKGGHSFKIESETAYVDQIFEERSSLALYGTFGVDLLVKNSPVLEFDQYDESEIDKLEAYLTEIGKASLSNFEQVERNFLETMLMLLLILHCKNIDEILIKKWCSSADEIDITLLFYLLDLPMHEEIWVFNGLVEFIEKLRSLNLLNKCNDIVKLLKFTKNELLASKIKNSIKSYNSLILMTDMNILRLQLQANDNDINVEDFEESSLEEITAIVEENSQDHLELLLKIYERRGMLKELINVLKKRKDVGRILYYLKKNAKNLPSTYKPEYLAEDLMFAIDATPLLNRSLIQEALNILQSARTDSRELLSKTGNNTRAKVFIIEEIGARSPDDKEFLINFYMAKMQEALQDGNIWDLFATFAAEYTQDMSYTKCSIADFLLIKLEHNDKCQSFVNFYRSIKDLCLQDDEERLLRSVVAQVKSFDDTNMLILLFISGNEANEEFLTEQQLLQAYLSFNDFLSIEKYVTESNILEVLRHYNGLPRGLDSLKLTRQMLKRNLHCIRNEETLAAILEEIPREYSLQPLFHVICTLLKRIDDEKRESELYKALLKDENTTYKTICTKILNE